MKSQTLKCLVLILLTALITAFLTCWYCKGKDIVDVPGGTRSNDICMDYTTVPPPTLTSDLVSSMVGTYSGAQLNNIQTATTNPVPNDARAIWFELETLKKFLYHIEHSANENLSALNGRKLGVRIYYAAYPKNDKMKDFSQYQTDTTFSFNPAYEGKHTLVMVPTISERDGNVYDFNPLDVNSYNGFVNMTPKGRYSNSNSYQMLTLGAGAVEVTSSGSTTVNVRNHGTLFPPESTVGFGF
ncbi:hypothetical protein [Flavobacterium sp.]|uniref:hypothetical protein n=1 Tax=Flavobacterium sp. TaxID=239 RepID=UPI00262D8B6F|nr:hypothetical protein [Flavobacterium sp.]